MTVSQHHRYQEAETDLVFTAALKLLRHVKINKKIKK